MNEKSANASKIYSTKKIVDIKIKYKVPPLMNFCVRYNGSTFMEAMRGEPELSICTLALINAFIKYVSQTLLQ